MRRIIASLAASVVIAAGLVAVAAPAGASGRVNGQIVFGKEDAPDGDTHVFTINPDGTHERRMYRGIAGCSTWSPDGTKVLLGCVFDAGDLVRPAIVDPEGHHFTLLNNPDPTLNLFCYPWSPDGLRLACEGSDDTDPARDGIYTVRAADGGDLRRLTTNPYGTFFCCPVRNSDGFPGSYSPDGSQLLFTRYNQQGQSALFIVNVDGTGTRQVTPWGLGGTNGNWSPTGDWIVFNPNDSSRAQGQLFLVHPDGSGRHSIDIDTNGLGYYAKEPSWSPGGTRIVFVMYGGSVEGWPDVYTVAPDGSHLSRVTRSPVTENIPSWGTHPAVT
jgi:Tol biopolymer transport system component